MKVSYIGYIRVSTTKQGEAGVTLSAQRRAIQEYAKRHKPEIKEIIEEECSA